MAMQHRVSGCLLASFLLCQPVFAAHDWRGYINDKLMTGQTYGFLSTVSKSGAASKLSLLCHSNGVTTLYFDEEIVDQNTTVLSLTIDQLPVVDLAIGRVGDKYEVSSRMPGFWNLVAQMSAGANLKIDSGFSGVHQYSLIGFTHSYLNNCGWLSGAKKYQEYMHYYR